MEDQICQHHKFGYCKFQKQCQKKHLEGQCEALGACKEIKTCNKRHPKACKRFIHDTLCKFGLDCAYAHIENDNSKLEATVIYHIANMKAEIIELKEVIQRLVPLDQTVNEIEHLKQEINKLKTENADIVNKINILQEDLKSDKEDESCEENTITEYDGLLSCNYCGYQSRSEGDHGSLINTHNNEETEEVLKCDKCEFNCNSMKTFRKHMNTRHPGRKEQNECNTDLNICPNCKKKFKTEISLRDHFQKIHVDKESDLYTQNMDMLLDMYEKDNADSDDDDTDSSNV